MPGRWGVAWHRLAEKESRDSSPTPDYQIQFWLDAAWGEYHWPPKGWTHVACDGVWAAALPPQAMPQRTIHTQLYTHMERGSLAC